MTFDPVRVHRVITSALLCIFALTVLKTNTLCLLLLWWYNKAPLYNGLSDPLPKLRKPHHTISSVHLPYPEDSRDCQSYARRSHVAADWDKPQRLDPMLVKACLRLHTLCLDAALNWCWSQAKRCGPALRDKNPAEPPRTRCFSDETVWWKQIGPWRDQTPASAPNGVQLKQELNQSRAVSQLHDVSLISYLSEKQEGVTHCYYSEQHKHWNKGHIENLCESD